MIFQLNYRAGQKTNDQCDESIDERFLILNSKFLILNS